MLVNFTSTRNRVPSSHMQSLYLSRPSLKYTSPAELGMRVALNMTDPLRTMLFSCREENSRHPLSSSCLGQLQKHTVTCWTTCFHTYSPELNVSTHFELYGPAHDVHPLITTNDSFAVALNVEVRCCTAGDLKTKDIKTFDLTDLKGSIGFKKRRKKTRQCW